MQSAQRYRKHTAQLPVMQVAYSLAMKKYASENDGEAPERLERPIERIRRARLDELIAEFGQAELARQSKTPKSHLSAMSNKARNLGGELATKLEGVADKPFGWMDIDPDQAPPEMFHGSAEPLSLADVVSALGRHLEGVDDLARETVTPLLLRIATNPGDADKIAARMQAIVAEALRDSGAKADQEEAKCDKISFKKRGGSLVSGADKKLGQVSGQMGKAEKGDAR